MPGMMGPQQGAIQDMLGTLAPNDQSAGIGGYVPGGGIYGGQPNIPPELLQTIQPTFANLPVAGMMGAGGQQPMARQQMTEGVPGGGFWSFAQRAQQNAPLGIAPGLGSVGGGYGSSYTGTGQSGAPLGVYPGEPSSALPSTDNWRLLPQGFNNPRFIMRNGHIIEKKYLTMPLKYVDDRGGEPTAQVSGLGGPGHNYPISFGNSVSRGYFWPGQIEPWETEGGQGTT